MAIATVIIPCGVKHLPLLPRAIRSAYAQTIPVKVKWYIDRDKGTPAYGRNLLANEADTPFIIMLDADDYLLPDFTETLLKHWKPGAYVYSSWYQGANHTHAVSCYGYAPKPGEADFHLPPSLFPTEYYRRLGGQNEKMFGAEDTDFFFRANARRLRSVRVDEPLFHYTPDGYRSKEASKSPKWRDLIKSLWDTYLKDMSMGCCNAADPSQNPPEGSHQEGDILARPKWKAKQRTHGRVTSRSYGKISSFNTVWLDPRDFNDREWVRVEDWIGLAPTNDQIQKALADSDPLVSEIAKAGLRVSWEPIVKSGMDIQQNPYELADLLRSFEENGVKTVLEIGTGESGGLARFLTGKGYTVTSVDIQTPDPAPVNEFILSDSLAVDLGDRKFDAVIIDGEHTDEYVRGDYAKFEPLATRIVAIHDIAEDGYYPDVAKFWKELAYTAKNNLRKGFFESNAPGAKMGIGWHVKSGD